MLYIKRRIIVLFYICHLRVINNTTSFLQSIQSWMINSMLAHILLIQGLEYVCIISSNSGDR